MPKDHYVGHGASRGSNLTGLNALTRRFQNSFIRIQPNPQTMKNSLSYKGV